MSFLGRMQEHGVDCMSSKIVSTIKVPNWTNFMVDVRTDLGSKVPVTCTHNLILRNLHEYSREMLETHG